MNTLIEVLMNRDGIDHQEAAKLVKEMQSRVNDGEDPEEVLYEDGLEPDYIFDLISF